MPEVLPFGLAPEEAIAHLKRKINVPTKHWYDMLRDAHAQSYTVAGAMKMELLEDLRGAVQTAITEGKSLQAFRKEFRAITQKHGWEYHGTEAWRSEVILNTNARTSYAVGRYQQMQEIKEERPYWEYRHSHESARPRPQHVAWDKMVLSADDPFWNVGFPPNAWGCNCYVNALSGDDMARLGLKVGTAPKIEWKAERVGGRWTKTPEGWDHGWDYNPGAADHAARLGQRFADRAALVDPRLGASAMQAESKQLLPALGRSWRSYTDSLISGEREATGELRMLGTASPGVVDALLKKGIQLDSAGIAMQDHNALRMGAVAARGREIALDVYRNLPEHIARPQAVYLDPLRQEMVIVTKADEEGIDILKLALPSPGKRWKGVPQLKEPLEILMGGRLKHEDIKNRGMELLEGNL